MTDADVIAEIRKLYEEMKDKCISLKMPRVVAAYRPENLELIARADLDIVLAWARATHKNTYSKVLKARALVPEDQWAYYSMMEVDGLQEQEALKHALSVMRLAFEERPEVLRRGWKPTSESEFKKKFERRKQREKLPKKGVQRGTGGTSGS